MSDRVQCSVCKQTAPAQPKAAGPVVCLGKRREHKPTEMKPVVKA